MVFGALFINGRPSAFDGAARGLRGGAEYDARLCGVRHQLLDDFEQLASGFGDRIIYSAQRQAMLKSINYLDFQWIGTYS